MRPSSPFLSSLCSLRNGATDRVRTGDLLVGNETFYQLNYCRFVGTILTDTGKYFNQKRLIRPIHVMAAFRCKIAETKIMPENILYDYTRTVSDHLRLSEQIANGYLPQAGVHLSAGEFAKPVSEIKQSVLAEIMPGFDPGVWSLLNPDAKRIQVENALKVTRAACLHLIGGQTVRFLEEQVPGSLTLARFNSKGELFPNTAHLSLKETDLLQPFHQFERANLLVSGTSNMIKDVLSGIMQSWDRDKLPEFVLNSVNWEAEIFRFKKINREKHRHADSLSVVRTGVHMTDTLVQGLAFAVAGPEFRIEPQDQAGVAERSHPFLATTLSKLYLGEVDKFREHMIRARYYEPGTIVYHERRGNSGEQLSHFSINPDFIVQMAADGIIHQQHDAPQMGCPFRGSENVIRYFLTKSQALLSEYYYGRIYPNWHYIEPDYLNMHPQLPEDPRWQDYKKLQNLG